MACTLDLIGDRWTLLVVRDLFLGKRHFEEFLASAEGIATNVLSDRLKSLREAGLVERQGDEADARRYVYALTAKGRTLGEVLVPIGRWGLAHLAGTRLLKEARPLFPDAPRKRT